MVLPGSSGRKLFGELVELVGDLELQRHPIEDSAGPEASDPDGHLTAGGGLYGVDDVPESIPVRLHVSVKCGSRPDPSHCHERLVGLVLMPSEQYRRVAGFEDVQSLSSRQLLHHRRHLPTVAADHRHHPPGQPQV